LAPLVFLHGIGTGPSGWVPQEKALGLDWDVLAPDLVPAYARGWDAAVQEVRRLVAERAPVDVCGLSLGGLAALAVASSRPEDVRRLAVCAGFARLPAMLRLRVRAIAMTARLTPKGVLHRQLVAELPEPHRSRALAEIAPLGPRRLSRLMSEAARFQVEVERITAPVLVLCGDRDEANTPLAAALAEALPSATLKRVSDAGHVANLDNPTHFTSLLAEFFSDVG
jgi:pimeloyl-ACP methyl ester carboxylesterase